MPTLAGHITLIDSILLSWRPGAGKSRCVVGRFFRNAGRVDFEYLIEDDMMLAFDQGFTGFPELPISQRSYTDVLAIISRRLIDPDRSDRIRYLEFWHAEDSRLDEFERVALTQAWLTNDRFEFLAEFTPQDGLTFVTDLAGQSHLKVDKHCLMEVESLYTRITVKKGFQYPVVDVYNDRDEHLGRIKKVHNRLFSHADIERFDIHLSIKDTDANGVLNKVFVEVRLKEKA